MTTQGGPNGYDDATGGNLKITVTTRVDAAPGSTIFLAPGSKGVAVAKGKTTFSAGVGSRVELAAGSKVLRVLDQDINVKRTGLRGIVIAGILVLAAGITFVLASFDRFFGPYFIIGFGVLALISLFVKEACTTFSKDGTVSKVDAERLVKAAAIASIFAVAFGGPAAAWTIKKAYSVAVEETKNSQQTSNSSHSPTPSSSTSPSAP